mgnify:CR=1 FL=1
MLHPLDIRCLTAIMGFKKVHNISVMLYRNIGRICCLCPTPSPLGHPTLYRDYDLNTYLEYIMIRMVILK